jgi:hypothetical protein
MRYAVCQYGLLRANGDSITYNVAMTRERAEKTARIEYRPMSSTTLSSRLSRSSKRPDDRVAFPRAIPPMAKKTIDQWNEWKSSCHVSPASFALQPTHLGEDTRSEESKQGYNGDDTHVSHHALEFLLKTPQSDSQCADGQDVVMCRRERVSVLSHLWDFQVAFPSVVDVQESPDGDDRARRDRDGNGKPGCPGDRRVHCAKGDEVLRRRDGRCLTTNIRR